MGASVEAPESRALADDVSATPGFVGVGREKLVGDEVAIALDGKAELTADGGDLGEADVAQLRASHAEIAEAEGKFAL